MRGIEAAFVPSIAGAAPLLLDTGRTHLHLGVARASVSWEGTALRVRLTSHCRAAVNGQELAVGQDLFVAQGDLVQVEGDLWEVVLAPNLTEVLKSSDRGEVLRDVTTRLYGRRVFAGVLKERLTQGDTSVMLLGIMIHTNDSTLVLRGRHEIVKRAGLGHGGRIFALERDVLAVIDPLSKIAPRHNLLLWGQVVHAEVREKQFSCTRATWSDGTVDEWLGALRELVEVSST